MDTDALLYAVVHDEPGGPRGVRCVVIPFEDAHAADEYARQHGYTDYTVAPLTFAAVSVPATRSRAGR